MSLKHLPKTMAFPLMDCFDEGKLSRFLTTGFTREILKYNTKQVKFTNIFLILYLEFCRHMSNMFANLTGFLLLLLTLLLILITKAIYLESTFQNTNTR